MHTYSHTLVLCVIGVNPANFSEFSLILVSSIEFGGITANFVKYKPKCSKFHLKSPCLAEIIPFKYNIRRKNPMDYIRESFDKAMSNTDKNLKRQSDVVVKRAPKNESK